MSRAPHHLPSIDDVVFSLGPALPERLLRTAEHPDWHFIPEEVRQGVVSGRVAVIGFEDDGGWTDVPEASDLLVFVSPAVRVRRSRSDPNRDYPHITHGEMLASVVCRAWDIPYSYRDFLALVGNGSVPAQRRATSGARSCYFRYDSRGQVFTLQGRLPQDADALAALRPSFEHAFADAITVSIGQVPPHLYHLRAPADLTDPSAGQST